MNTTHKPVVQMPSPVQLDGESDDQYQFRKRLADLFLRAAYLYEAGFDHVAADAATAANDLEIASRTEAGEDTTFCVVFYEEFQLVTMHEACEKACAELGLPLLSSIVYISLGSWWNDATDWASGKDFELNPDLSTNEK